MLTNNRRRCLEAALSTAITAAIAFVDRGLSSPSAVADMDERRHLALAILMARVNRIANILRLSREELAEAYACCR